MEMCCETVSHVFALNIVASVSLESWTVEMLHLSFAV